MEEKHGWGLRRTVWAVFFILVLGAAPVWAALGEPESSVSADGQFLRGQIRVEVHPGYQIHQITDPSGAIVREYVSPEGKVFGVSWQGPFVPNLQQLLGGYFTYLQQYAHSQTGRHGGPLIIKNGNFVFSSGGHMGWRHGHAYVPSLLPTNLSREVVQ